VSLLSHRMLYIDVTDTFASWHGSPNGIQRVLIGLAEAAEGRSDCQLCVWNKAADCWRLLPPERAAQVFRGSCQTSAPARRSFLSDLLAFLLDHLRAAARGALHAISRAETTIAFHEKPPYFRVPLSAPVSRFREFRKSHAKEVVRRGAAGGLPVVDFSGGRDAVLFADSHWNTPGILESLRRQPGSPVAIGFVHDVISLERPDFVSDRSTADFRRWLDEMQSHCGQILCNSDYSAKRLAANLSPTLPVPSVRSVRFGNAVSFPVPHVTKLRRLGELCSHHFATTSGLPDRASAADSWYLWIGSLDIRKNVDVLLLAIEGLARRGLLSRPVVIVGRRSTGSVYYRHKIARNPALAEWVVHIEAAPDDLLQALQRQAALVLFTSWEEGYGLPVAEALQAGVPVVASNATSIPEVAGELVEYFEPWDSGQLARLVARFEEDEPFRADLTARARRFVPTGWDETIADIVAGLPVRTR